MTVATATQEDSQSLTALQRRWLELFLDGPRGIKYNSRQAAIAAGYSESSAHNQGSRNNRNPKIRRIVDARLAAEIAALRKEHTAQIERDARKVMT